MSSFFEIAVIVMFILLNGVFAMSEAALISARKARLKQRANEGDSRARAALDFVEKPTAFLATTQIAISLIGILSGAFGGATIATTLANTLSIIKPLAPYSQAIALGLVVLLITYLSLIIGELVPKQVALNNPEGIISVMAGPMRFLSRLAAPLVRLLSLSTALVLRLIGARASDESVVTEEEIKVMIEQGTQAGEFEDTERYLIGRVFRLADLPVEAIMTPRTDVAWLDVSDSPDVIRHKINASGRSRFPVARGDLDNVLGVVRAKDLLARSLTGKPLDLRASMHTPLFVPATVSALRMFHHFKQSSMDMALVIDEFGGMQGVVTMADVLDEIVGGEFLPSEAPQPRVTRREDGTWLIDGLMAVDEVKATLGIRDLPGEASGDYATLGGLIMSAIGRIPEPGDHVDIARMRFEVVDMDGHRVDKVLVTPLPPAEPGDAGAESDDPDAPER